METVEAPIELDSEPRGLKRFAGKVSWRMILVRLVVNGLTLIAVAALVPNIYFVDKTLLSVFLMAFVLGLLNAFVKPIIQFLTLPFVFATYGFAIVLINTVILLLLAIIFEERFFVGSFASALLGGLVMGLIASLLESLLGLDMPIVSTTPGAIETQAHVSQTIEKKLVDKVAGTSVEQPAHGENVSEPPTVVEQGESPLTDTAGSDPVISELTDDEAPAPTEVERSENAQADENDEQNGDEL